MSDSIIVNDNMTLAEAKEVLRAALDKGAKCPCCARHTQMYKRKITSGMAYGLILIYQWFKRHGSSNEWLHLEQYFKSLNDLPASIRGDVPKLRFWGLIQPRSAEGEDGNPNDGFYKITDRGRQFVEMKTAVASHIKVYNNRMYGTTEKSSQVNITQALGDKFNYNQLMGKEVKNEPNNNSPLSLSQYGGGNRSGKSSFIS